MPLFTSQFVTIAYYNIIQQTPYQGISNSVFYTLSKKLLKKPGTSASKVSSLPLCGLSVVPFRLRAVQESSQPIVPYTTGSM